MQAARCTPALCGGKPNDLAAGTASHRSNFLAARLNGMENSPKRPAIRRIWIEIGHVLRPAAERLELAVARRHCVGDEHQVELAALGGLRDLGVMSEVRTGVDLRVRVQPTGHVVSGRVKERTELHPLAAAFLVHPRSPGSAQIQAKPIACGPG